MNKRLEIFAAIEAERKYQENKWGHLDPTNTPHEWSAFIAAYATRNLVGDPRKVDKVKFVEDMRKVAAIAVAAIEQYTKE